MEMHIVYDKKLYNARMQLMLRMFDIGQSVTLHYTNEEELHVYIFFNNVMHLNMPYPGQFYYIYK